MYNVTDLSVFKTPKIMSKSCFQCKEMPMAKRGKVLTFHSWLNLAMEDVLLGLLSLVVSVIVKPETSSQTHQRMG